MIDQVLAFIIANYVSQYINTVLIELAGLIIQLFGFQLFSERYEYKSYLTENIIKNFHTSTFDGLPCGIIMGYGYIGYIRRDWRECTLDIITTKDNWENLRGISKNPKFDCNRRTFAPEGGLSFSACKKLKPRNHQRQVLDKLIKHFNKNNITTSYIYGEPGAGKSKVGYLLAHELNATLYKSTMEECTKNFSRYYERIKPSLNQPLIVMFDEVDDSISKIFNPDNSPVEENEDIINYEKLKLHKSTKKTNNSLSKRSWNQFLDDVNDGTYPYVIIILTSNVTKEEIDNKNNSLLRAGRIDIIVEMSKTNAVISLN